MLKALLSSPLLTSEAAYCFFSPLNVSTSTPNSTLVTWNPLRIQSSIIVCPSKEWKLHSSDQMQATVLYKGEDKETWEESKKVLTQFNFTLDEAETILGKAFGWTRSPYWGEERERESPNKESVGQVLDYLRSLGLSDDDLHKLLKKFPEVLGCGLDDEVRANISTLDAVWGVTGKALRNLLLRNPKVLGYNVDCKGDCMAKCTRCWVRF